MNWWKPWKWRIPKRPTMKPNTYDSIYSMKTNPDKSSWLKQQGKEAMKALPKTVVTAAMGVGMMAGARVIARPNQLQSGDNSANRENQALFIYDHSNSTGLNTFKIIAIPVTSTLLIIMSPILIMNCKEFRHICLCRWMKNPP